MNINLDAAVIGQVDLSRFLPFVPPEYQGPFQGLPGEEHYRLLGHLSRSAKLADTLAVERELSRVRMEIERLEGRMRYLQHRIAYCTLDITLRPVARTQPLVPPQSFSSGKVASDAVRSLVGFAQRLWSLVIWLAVWAVVWLPLLLAGWYGYRRRQRA